MTSTERKVLEVRDPERALDGVVVGDRDEIHPARPGNAVDPVGVGEGFAEAGAPQRIVPAIGGEARVDVQIATCVAGRLSDLAHLHTM